jgi:hypothetical protein
MPKTKSLSDIHLNRVYALDAEVKYVHHNSNRSTVIIEEGGIQGRMVIPHSPGHTREEME